MNLRELLDDPAPAASDGVPYAVLAARRIFSAEIMNRLQWGEMDGETAITVATLTGDDGKTLTIRFDEGGEEPFFEVRVPCETDPACFHAWDRFSDQADLVNVLDGRYEDPVCEVHDGGGW